MTLGPAMTRAEALRAVATGIDLAGELSAGGVDLLGIGEMGIGNTTAASAICAVLTGRPVAEVTGRGTGIDDATPSPQDRGHRTRARGQQPRPARPDRRARGRRRSRDRAARRRHRRRLPRRASRSSSMDSSPGPPRSSPRSSSRQLPPRLIAAHRSIEPGHAVDPRDARRAGRCSTSTCGSGRGPVRRWRWA